MPSRDVVMIVRQYLEDEGATLEERYGPQAATIAGDIVAILDARLTEDDLQRVESAHPALWQRFLDEPETVTVEMTGILESMTEADVGLARRLDGLMQRLHRVMANRAAPERPASEVGIEERPANLPPPQYTSADAIHDADQEGVEEADGYSKGEGAYLYGNVRQAVPFMDERGVQIVSLGGRGPEEATGLEAASVPQFFARLSESVRSHPDLQPGVRKDLLAAFADLQDEVEKGPAADVDRLVELLTTVRRHSSDVWELVLGYWDLTTYTEASGSKMQEALQRLKESSTNQSQGEER